MKPDGVGIMVDDLGETDPSEFFVQLGMLILESRQPFTSVKGRQDGPHCPKDVGIWSGHVCGSTSVQCIKTNQILKQMQTMWRNQVPLCVEVLILPSCPHGQLRSVSTDVTPPYEDDSYVLLEQWTIQTVQKKPGETIVSPKNLFQALKSYLHFSQLSSWLSSSQGKRPSCIGYRVSPPAEFCTTTFTQDPQLHVFPVGNVNKSTNFKVWLAYLSRMPEIPEPICHEISESGHPCFSNHASKSLSKGALNKKRVSRSKSPCPRFEAVFQNITGSPKLVSKSCSSTLSKQRLPMQQCQLGSILEAPMLQSVSEAAFKNCFPNDAVDGLPSDWKDDAYGIGYNDYKSQCEVKIGHVASVRGGVNVKTLPLLTAGIETGMKNLKLTSELSGSHLSLEDSYWSATSPSFYDEPNENYKESIGNCYLNRGVDISLPRNLQSKHCSMPSKKLPCNSSTNRELELINRSLSPDFSRIKKSSMPINIAAKRGELGMNFAQMLLKDQSVTDSENSCSPDFDLLLNETLVNMAEPMNPEEMYERLSRLCKKKHPGSKCSIARDVTWQQSHLEPSKMNVTSFRDEVPHRNDNSDLDNSMKNRLPSEDNDKQKSVISGNPSKHKCVCDNNRASLASPDCMKSESHSCFASENFDREGLNKRELSFSEASEFLDSLKDQNSIKRQKKDQTLEEVLASSLETDEQRPMFSVGDEAGDTQLWHTSKEAFTSTQFERSHQRETQEYECNFLKSNDYIIHEENIRAANLLKSFKSNQPQQRYDADNVQGVSYLPPSTLHLCNETRLQSEVTPLRSLSAIPRRLQSKTPQDSKHPSMLFGDPKSQSLLQQKSPDTNVSNLTKSNKGLGIEDRILNGNGYHQSGPRVPTEVEKKGFRVRVQHSSSMVFNSRTKLPMQSSPVPAKRLSAGCFDYDSSLNSVQAIKNSLSCNNLDDAGDNSDGCNRLKQAFSSSAPASTNCLLGNFEESLINGRIQPAGVIDGFAVEIGASGSFCPSHLTLPCLAFFFSLSEDSAPSPYLGHINLESHSKRGYKVPNKGTVQVTLFNPNKSVVKIFVVTYDVSDMPPNHQTLLRQKTVYMPTPGSPSDVPGAPVYLRYLIHLRFASSKQCKIYLHTDIRLIFARDRFELDNRIYHYELRSFTEAPENPKYSPKR